MSIATPKSGPATAERRTGILTTVENRVAAAARVVSLPLLRVSLGVVFIWFGALKVADATPVGDLVAATVPWLDRGWFVPALGLAEVLMGIALLIGRYLSLASAVLAAHLCATFLVLVMQPDVAFQSGNPLLLTTIGEFVIKNVVLISAALVIASKLRGTNPQGRASTQQTPNADRV
jgi:uncharacterized membrane protein YkgB